MFQPFGLLVNLIPGVVEEIVQETLQQTMVAKDFQSSHLSGRRQTHAVMLFIFHQGWLLCSELLQHSSYGSGTDIKMTSEGIAGNPSLFRAAQLQYRFQVVVHRFRGVRR